MPKQSTNSAIIMQTSPDSQASEAFRSLRFHMEYSGCDQEIQTVTITSAGRGEGKTTTAINLAAAYTQIGKKVILLDADLRNPSIHLTFGWDNNKGLASFLANQSSMNEIIRESDVENLSVITTGTIPKNPAELLASKRMNTLLAELKQNYDMVIIDSAPVLAITDTKILAAKCDGVILVVEHGKVKRNAAKKVKEELSLTKTRFLGVVFNKMNLKDAEAFL